MSDETASSAMPKIAPKMMSEKTKRGLEILQAALVLGVLGDSLIRATPWGLNAFLWVTAFAVGLWVVVIRHREEKAGIGTIALNASLIFFAAMFVWRDSVSLMILDVAAMLAILSVLALPAMNLKMQQSGVVHYALGWIYSGFNCAIAPFFLLIEDIRLKSLPKRKGSQHFAALIRGLLVAVPILLIFGALFVAADAAFQELIEKTFHIDIEQVLGHIFLAGFMSWLIAGFLRGTTFSMFEKRVWLKNDGPTISPQELKLTEEENAEKEKAEKEKPDPFDLQNINNSFLPSYFTLGTIELVVILGLMNLLFLSFVIVQIPYLFGGMELVQNIENFKLAEYARRGFAELVWVSALVLPLLLAAHWLIRKGDKAGMRIYRVLASAQITLLFVIMASATQRLLLYTGTSGYGLTVMRFYPMVFMIWLAVVFIWFAATVLRGKRQRFAWGALWSALVFVGVLHVFNPDKFIARTNFALMHSGRSLDTDYIKSLSDDAVPALLEEIPALDSEQKCQIEKNLIKRLQQSDSELDLRSWNWSRRTARRQLINAEAGFDTSTCGEKVREIGRDEDPDSDAN
jgi:hypothetical protein